MSAHLPHIEDSDESRLPLTSDAGAALEGAVARITYVSEETQYVVARLDVPGRGDPVTIVGTLPSLTVGETLRVHGRWFRHPKYGEQFQVERYEPIVPATVTGIRKYLGSGAIKGIGPVFAERLVEAFGADTLQVIDTAPERLAEVPGLGPKRRARIAAAWAEQHEIRNVMVFLQGHEVSPAYAARVFRRYGQAAVATVRADPYRLAQDIPGIGFQTADRIARALGIAPDSPQRARAGLRHGLAGAAEEGHAFALAPDLLRTAERDLAIPAARLGEALAALAAAGEVIVEAGGEGQAVYLPALHAAEVGTAARLAILLATPRRDWGIEAAQALARAEGGEGQPLAPDQREALRLALQAKVLVVTGGPGTGKTTILKSLLAIVERAGVRAALASPTGRAARRMAETAGREASTIHRLLEWAPAGGGFQRNAERPLEADLVVVDEVSMIDLPLMHALLLAIPPAASLLLVGDADQLPSVGPGSVLRDILESGEVPAVRLTHIFRQAEQSRIVRAAVQVNRGEVPDFSGGGPTSDCYFLAEEDAERLQALVVDLVARRIPGRYGLDPVEAIQVLSPMHRGAVGARELNALLQARLNPPRPGVAEILRGGRVIRVGDRVMQLRNDYEKEVSNGDIGQVVEVDPVEQTVIVALEGRRVAYDFGDLDELTLAYASTVHKSQGSEYPVVVLPLHTTHYPMLQRNLLYTAITRARRLLVLAGMPRALALAVKNDATQRRNSALVRRLRGAGTPPGPLQPKSGRHP